MTVGEVSYVVQNWNTPQCVIHLDYTLCENGLEYTVRRTKTGQGSHYEPPFFGIGTANIEHLRALITQFESMDRTPVSGFGPMNPIWTTVALSRLYAVASKQVKAATPVAPNPYQVIANNLQNQMVVAAQTNNAMKETIATQNQNIEALQAQEQSRQNSINSLNSTIAALQAQLALLPTQTQISTLEKEVANLRAALNRLLAMV